MHRLLDSSILKSCNAVFEAFDEGVLFREAVVPEWWSLKRQFKGVFHNVSRVLDCVSCQKCRLHAKVTMLGYGCALKLLLLPPELLPTAISRDEIVALFNTLAKFSSAIGHVKELTEMIYANYYAAEGVDRRARRRRCGGDAAPAAARRRLPPLLPLPSPSSGAAAGGGGGVGNVPPLGEAEATPLLDVALGAIAAASRAGRLGAADEALGVRLAMARDPRVLLLAKHFGGSPAFAEYLAAALGSAPAAAPAAAAAPPPRPRRSRGSARRRPTPS